MGEKCILKNPGGSGVYILPGRLEILNLILMTYQKSVQKSSQKTIQMQVRKFSV